MNDHFFLRQPPIHRPKLNDLILFFSATNDSWEKIRITSRGMGCDKRYFNFRFLRDNSPDGAYFLPGEAWGLLSEEDYDLNFDDRVVIGFDVHIPQDDGPLPTPSSLSPTPRSTSLVQPPVSPTRPHFLSEGNTDAFFDDNYEDQQCITLDTDDEDILGHVRPLAYEDVRLDQVNELSKVLPATHVVARLDHLLPLPEGTQEEGQEGGSV